MRRLAEFFSDRRGVAAVEMALISPFIVGFALLSVSVWDVGMRKQDMRGGLKLASQYYLNGGQSDTAAKTIALSAWENRPQDGTIAISRFCRCVTVAASCSGLCPDGAAPSAFVQLVAQASDPTAMFSPSQTQTELLRVR